MQTSGNIITHPHMDERYKWPGSNETFTKLRNR